MRVTWFVLDKPRDCTVEFGATAALGHWSQGTWEVYYKDYGYHCSAVMDNLHDGTKYFYRVGSHGDQVWSVPFRFRQPTSNPNTNFSMSVFGDMGFKNSG